MLTSAPIVDVSPQVRDAFDEGCRAVFKTSEQRVWVGRETRELLLRFAAHYQRLIGLPRRTRRSIERRWKHALSAIALLMTLGSVPAWAAVIQVSPGTPPSIKADGKCSLIEAIVNANRNARTHLDCVAGGGTDTITLPASSQQRLNGTETLPPITSRIVIEGRQSTISRNTDSRPSLTFFNVSASGDLTLNETIVTGAVGNVFGGQGIINRGRLTLNDSSLMDLAVNGLKNSGGVAVIRDSRITGNYGGYEDGGGVENLDGGRLTVTNSVISGNGGYFKGGGIFNGSGCSVTLTDSVVSDNRISYEGSGGGIENYGTLVLVGTTVAGNRAQFGAGIVNRGTATIRRSTISGNRIDPQYDYQSAGGIGNTGTLTLVNSTVSGNEARGYGGGISSSGTLTIVSSTVTGNVLAAGTGYNQTGGGVAMFNGTLTLQRSIVSGNTARTVREIYVDADVVVKANDFNLFGRAGDAGVAGFTPGSTDIVPNEPIGGILLPLADNGGDFDTRTHALAMGSPALDASPDDETCPTVDQRGTPRPRGPLCDIGSFEGAAVLCNGRVTTMVGTDGPDELTGTSGEDVIAGLNGNDAIGGLGGNDTICAGGGADNAFGGAGNDKLFGQGGNDQLYGNGGTDTLDGGPGTDHCDGGTNSGAGDTAAACETVSNVP
jgi:predicted outer membrane repeat protein